ncbi:hypothetical protein V8E54_008700 [Elaphomyces granulatus]
MVSVNVSGLSLVDVSGLSPIDAINSSTFDWGLQSLPTNLTIFNSSVPNNTYINGQLYNGSDINGTTVVVRFPSTTVGTLGTTAFVYLIMSLTILMLIILPLVGWLRALLDLESSTYRNRLPPVFSQNPSVSERQFGRRLRRLYERLLQRSYVEVVPPGPHDRITPQELRDCRELIRSRYKLDIMIYNASEVYDQHAVDEQRRQAAGALADLHQMIQGWMDGSDWQPEEWAMVEEIHGRIQRIVQNNGH